MGFVLYFVEILFSQQFLVLGPAEWLHSLLAYYTYRTSTTF